jgi:general stress protein 26
MTEGKAAMLEVDRLLAAARATLAEVTDCWVMTPSESGGVHARVLQPIDAAPDDEEWTISFITGAGSRKAAEIERAGCLTLGYQRADRGYVTLSGRATLVRERSVLRARWREPWRVHFPSGAEDSRLTLVQIAIDRIEICIAGVSPEPFGSRYVAVARDAAGVWAVAPR